MCPSLRALPQRVLALDRLSLLQRTPSRGAKCCRRCSNKLRAHHEERLNELLQACTAQALSAHDALPVLFKRPLNVHQTTFAMGESVAHLHMLWLGGQLQRELGADGIYRFSRTQS